MRTHPLRRLPVLLLLTSVLLVVGCGAPRVTTPEEEFGHPVGADYVLVDYVQLKAYWEKLADESNRMVLETIGPTSQGRDQLMAIITSPANHRRIDYYRETAARLARARGVDESEALRLAAEGKAVVWIDGGLHATEVVGAQQILELVYHMVSSDDEETRRILDEVILLAVPANPDGMDLVSDWYMRESEPEARSTRNLPVLYQEYAGHDNNRDQYMVNLVETENMNRIMYREWYPQIVYNPHQSGPAGTILFAPPYRDPPNHNFDPLIITSIEQVGTAMHHRFVAEGKGGSTMRSGARYSTWWNGGQRTTPYFHNMIGLLTEIVGHPTPMEIPYLPDRQISSNDLPLPVEPGTWHMRQSIDYSMTADLAVLDYASRNRDVLLYNIWRMGSNQIEAGSRDSWTVVPHRIATEQERLERGRGDRADFEAGLRRPEDRSPRGFILPSDQSDFLTATKFVNTLMKCGVEVHRPLLLSRFGDEPIRPVPTWSSPLRPSGRMCSICSSLRTTPMTSRIPAVLRPLPTTVPAGRWPTRWAWSSTGCSTGSKGRSNSSGDRCHSRPGRSGGGRGHSASCSVTRSMTPYWPSTDCSGPGTMSTGSPAGSVRRVAPGRKGPTGSRPVKECRRSSRDWLPNADWSSRVSPSLRVVRPCVSRPPGSGFGTVMAAPCHRAGSATCWNSSSSTSNWSFRNGSMRVT